MSPLCGERLRSGCRLDFIWIQIQVCVRTRHDLLDKVKVNTKARLEGEFWVTFLSIAQDVEVGVGLLQD